MKCLSTLAILLLFLVSRGWSQTQFFSFEETFDGPIDDDDPATWLSGGIPVTLTPTNGDLVLTDPPYLAHLGEFSLGLTEVSKHGDLVLARDTSAQTVFRVSAENVFGSIYTRSGVGVPGGDGGAYFGNITGSGVIQAGSFLDFAGIQVFESKLRPFAEGRDVVLQLDTIGNIVTASAWYADEPKPKSPPFATFTDDVARPPGVFGVSFGGFGSVDDVRDISATFRSFKIATGLPPGITGNPGLDGFIPPGLRNGLPSKSHHAVPEPSSALLSLLGVTICCLRRRQSNVR